MQFYISNLILQFYVKAFRNKVLRYNMPYGIQKKPHIDIKSFNNWYI